jgi:Chemotaxis protein histidine kinase and related kinases
MPQNQLNKDESLTLLFISETHDQLERFTELLLNWDQQQEDLIKSLNELFRIAHNIKGAAAMMGLTELKDAVHVVEDLFDAIRKDKLELDSELIDSLLRFSDDILLYIQNGQWEETDPLKQWQAFFDTGLAEAPRKIVNKSDAPLILNPEEKEAIASWQESGKLVYGIEVEFSPEAEMQGASALIFMRALPQYGVVFKTAPLEQDLKEEKFTIFRVVFFTEQLLSSEQEAAIISYPMYDVIAVKIRQWVYRPEEAVVPGIAKPVKVDTHVTERTIRVDAVKIDRLVSQVGELLHIKASLAEFLNHKKQPLKTWDQLSNTVEKFEQIVENLQSEVIDLRMVPVRNIFSRFSRIVHDIAKQRDKQVELVFFGEETEIDKQVAEQLVDPLTHLIRNAVDHGLESEETRLAAGKTRMGKVTLGAYQEGDNIVISVQDDGQGLNLGKIRAKGIQNGLIHETDELAEEEIRKLIFQPGFSTAETISDISGRGVGLDVVQDSIKKLKGDIVIDSTVKEGTTFRLKIPLTLAIIQSFMVKLGGQIFGIPATDVIESLAIEAADIHHITDKQVFTLRDQVIALLDLDRLFHYPSPKNEGKIPVIIVQYGHASYGLLVEELLGQEELMIKQINKALAENPLISGAAFVGGGDIALILDTHQIIKKYAS